MCKAGGLARAAYFAYFVRHARAAACGRHDNRAGTRGWCGAMRVAKEEELPPAPCMQPMSMVSRSAVGAVGTVPSYPACGGRWARAATQSAHDDRTCTCMACGCSRVAKEEE